MKPRSRTTMAAAVLLILVCGCAQGVNLSQKSESGGIVTYPFSEQGYLLSPFRKEALQMIGKRCGGSYRIVREGETRGRSRLNENVGGVEMIQQRRWGIEFECKS